MTLPDRLSLRRRLQIEPGEGGALILLSLNLFLIIGSTAVIGRTVSRSLFLSGLPSQYIPARYLAVTAGVVLASVLYARIAGRFRTGFLLQRTTLAMIAGLLLFRLLLSTGIGNSLWLLGAFYMFLEVVMAMSIVQFWTFASESFTTRQAGRLFPSVTAVGNLGSMLAGASVTALAPRLGTPNLLYVMAGMLAATILLVRSLDGRQGAADERKALARTPAARPSRSGVRSARGLFRQSPLLGAMAIIVVLVTLAVNIVDYQFDLSLKRSFAADPQGISTFLGSFYFWTGIAGLVQQLILTGPLLRRFGIAASLLVMPLGILAGSLMVLTSGAALWAVTVARSPDTVFRYTVHDTAFNLLYVPIPHELRLRARTLIDGIFKPFTIGLAGVLFFLADRLTGTVVLPWSVAAILVVALVMIATLRLRPLYLATLQDSIRRRYFDPASEPLDLHDGTTINTIKDALRQHDEAQVLHALALADEIATVDWTPALLPLVEHDSPLVRQQALRMLRRPLENAGPSAQLRAARVKNCFEDPAVDVRSSAIVTYWALRGAAALAEMQPFMDHADPRISSAATSGALRYGGEAAREVARPLFAAIVEHPRQAVRAAAASVLGELPPQDAAAFLGILLEDAEPEVRRQAARAAGQLADPRWLPALMAQLGDPVVGPVAEEALVRYGAQIFPYLDALYAEPILDTTIRRRVPGVISRIHAPQSVRFLMSRLDEPDDLARSRVYIALGRLCQGGERLSAADLAAVNRRFEVESRLTYEWSVRAFKRQPDSHGDLLDDAYFWRRRYAVDRLLYLVALLYPQANSALLRANLFGADQRRRSNAIEMLDTLLSRPYKERLLPLLEGRPERVLEIAEREYDLQPPAPEAEFATALERNDPWLAACILFSCSRTQEAELSDLIHQAFRLPDDLLCETAQWAARQNIPSAAYQIASPATVSRAHSPNSSRIAGHYLPPPAVAQEGGPVMPLTTMERILLLRRVALFKETPAQELERVARLCDVLYFAPGERFICQGDVADGLYILAAGEVEVSTEEFGVIDLRKEGDVIGEIGVLANQLRTANCTATVKTTALHISQTDLWDLLERDATLSVSVIRVLMPILLGYSRKRPSTAAGRAPFHMTELTPYEEKAYRTARFGSTKRPATAEEESTVAAPGRGNRD